MQKTLASITTLGTISIHNCTREQFDKFPSTCPEKEEGPELIGRPYWFKRYEMNDSIEINFYTDEPPVEKKAKTVFVLYTDTHNGAADFEVFRYQPEAEAAFMKTVNEVFSLTAMSFEEAEANYANQSQNPFNEDWIWLEEVTLQ